MNVTKLITDRYDNIRKLENEITALERMRPKLESLNLGKRTDHADPYPFFVGGTARVDFDYLTHEDVIRVIQAFPGKWEKRPGTDGIHYVLSADQNGGTEVYCWNGAPPPSCKVIEEWVDVPAQPATRAKVKKIVCPEFEDHAREERKALINSVEVAQ